MGQRDWRSKAERVSAARELHGKRPHISIHDLMDSERSRKPGDRYTAWERGRMEEVFGTMSERMAEVGDAAHDVTTELEKMKFAVGGAITSGKIETGMITADSISVGRLSPGEYVVNADDIILHSGDSLSFSPGSISFSFDSLSARPVLSAEAAAKSSPLRWRDLMRDVDT